MTSSKNLEIAFFHIQLVVNFNPHLWLMLLDSRIEDFSSIRNIELEAKPRN